MDNAGREIAYLLGAAWLLPLVGFVVEIFGGYYRNSTRNRLAARLAVGCIAVSFVLSVMAFCRWKEETHWSFKAPAGAAHASVAPADQPHAGAPAAHPADAAPHATGDHAHHATPAFSGTFYTLARFGSKQLSIDYYVDSLTVLMFCMVTLIATCIHLFAMGYMADELVDEYVDHHAHLRNGHHVHRRGRFYRFFAYLSLFCFSMLGLVLAGNIFQVFVFWELVGICSFFLIGFYVERRSANVAANKAFIANRVGDFGFIIGLMILWTSCGTFSFGDTVDQNHQPQPGLFSMLRGSEGTLALAGDDVLLRTEQHGESWAPAKPDHGGPHRISYALLVVAGLGIFAGCVGKSAQFPLHTWLPDAMEGPTPVSALVHSATMVAAGVYLAGRFFPVFTPEVLLVIAWCGCITLFLAATIAVVATDIKKVLAYSTISQLGYMMLGIGLGGWAAGLFHLITHAFFKSLMFLCSGSVIHGCHHEQEMPRMGGLIRKMPITGWTMFVGVVAIAGLAIPGSSALFGQTLAFSGYHSKDAILATSLAYIKLNPAHTFLFIIPVITAGITAFYMFRLWFYTFLGKPRDLHIYEHCHESPRIMWLPLVVLSVFAAGCAWGGEGGPLFRMLLDSEPGHVAAGISAARDGSITMPNHPDHVTHATAGMIALIAAASGTFVAWLLYCRQAISPADISARFTPVYSFLCSKWQFDELYHHTFVRPCHRVARWCSSFDRSVLDRSLHATVAAVLALSRTGRWMDEKLVDGLVNMVGRLTLTVGNGLKVVQTGSLRQYVMFIALGVLSVFAVFFVSIP